MKRTGLICVTRNKFPLLETTLESLLRHTPAAEFHLYLIDNASDDRTLELYSRDLPEHVTLVRNLENLKWVKGVNLGLDLAKHHDYVCLLNNDIEVGKDWLGSLVSILDTNPKVGAVGPLTSNSRDWQGYDSVREKLPQAGLAELQGISRDDVSAMQSAVAGNPSGIVVGGMLAFFCTLFRRSLFDEIGYLDEEFNDLLLGDDDDFCWRLQKAGHLLALATNTYVAHRSGTSSLALPEFAERQRKATELLLRKRAGS